MPQEPHDDYDTWVLKLPIVFQDDMPPDAREFYDNVLCDDEFVDMDVDEQLAFLAEMEAEEDERR